MTELMQYLPAYIQALGVTLWLSLCAAFGGMLLGFALNGLCGKRGLAFRLWRVYVWAVRARRFWRSWPSSTLACRLSASC
jgi:polar amino acid transport system permease protein/cystine transport system permease protein